ncbi:MAG: hypothetical protein ACRDN8_05820, partial [Thermoleophilaceae bacterium]
MQRESGQATVEWVALVLMAALILAAATKLAAPETDRDLGELVAKRITRPAGAAAEAPPTRQPAPAPSAPAPA